ncbi:hybrid sensor histidine kinase/response regulator [Vibrio fluvialis]|uniref:hybrid sensor histidine kinase/response regulator n=1 Tax=Vibrio sp. bablab_jr001 TaxID=2755067 RepID=UPI0018F1A19A|nr:PAS domain-containing hybrid sensor histidine kinase/response regulator [Vibrio sp. bablab_jr001]EKO3401036.1 PAS-domain containing protein [Vibrio fluvialis]EKO3475546.1 PAS-domain containing protein [Vibrio fluvialis]MBY8117562.1 hybrid sensor histidine kinase/response regulator [Vibrio fluvialis]MBY8250208.1 hybrid sensor histidine kinase/response regulator [Vibrio fluvialis]MBY8284011.1 hybrid sensor histidine kinase/response regulator [Vibrio fluvialis]
MQGWLVIPVSLMYLGVLFLIAWYGDRQTRWLAKWRPWIYSLSIAVYCTSWTFYGTVGQASANPWSFLPIYIAPILVFAFGWRILARLILIAKREHITSIADFIGARYGKSQGLAVAVTLIAVAGILPYIALQLRGITMGLNIVAPDLREQFGYQDDHVSWFVVLALALFTMLFGTRHIDNTEHHRGMMMAIAFESIVKLVAFLVVGLFILFLAFSNDSVNLIETARATYQAPNWPTLFIHTVLTMIAIICLPRQFHTMVVENERAQDLHTARWLFPIYLILMGLFVLPIAWVGQSLLGGTSPDTFVISVPMSVGAEDIALLAFLGGTSAASGMVIVSTIALAIMVSNDLVMPLLLRRMRLSQRNHRHFSGLLVIIRRTLILLLLLGAWGFYLALDTIPSLSAIGFLSFSAITQFAPALIGGMYWREGNRKGVYVGLAVGFTLWLITLMTATNMLAGDEQSNILLWLITPLDVLGSMGLKNSDWGMILSVSLNALCYVLVSWGTRSSLSERLQSAAFVGTPLPENENMSLYQSRVTVGELEMLASRFVGRTRVRAAFTQYWGQQRETLMPNQQAPSTLIRHTERVLAGVFGASSAKLVLTSALQGRNMQLEEVATIVDEASELYDFSRGLLQGAIEHIGQGIAVVDKQLRLVAWNQRYLELFDFPLGLIQVGRPIADVIRHNAEQGLCGPGDPEDHVRRRVYHLEQGSRHTSSRVRPDGRVIEVQGNPMPGGGFVMSFTDITVFRDAEQTLKEANENLEERVLERTRELEKLNKQLVSATQRSERESQSKSRFLAAVSHDLMQPLNAARLFASSLAEVARDDEVKRLSHHIESALSAAEDLIGDLLDISRLESGKLEIHPQSFAIKDVLANLNAEFSALARQQGVDFCMVPSSLYVRSDPKLLRRVVQNFLTNAFRYNPKGKVLLGVRRINGKVRIDVWDNGIGIEEDKQQEIFEEFNRGGQVRSDQGLGLGLAISKGIAHVLGHEISMRSWPGRGSVFSLTLEQSQPVVQEAPIVAVAEAVSDLSYLRVLCVDNEEDILVGMRDLLERWGCEVKTATDLVSSLKALDNQWIPDVILSDYRLDNGRTGLEVLQQCRLRLGDCFEGIIISADRSADILDGIKSNGFGFIAKPVKPIKLRAMLNRVG